MYELAKDAALLIKECITNGKMEIGDKRIKETKDTVVYLLCLIYSKSSSDNVEKTLQKEVNQIFKDILGFEC